MDEALIWFAKAAGLSSTQLSGFVRALLVVVCLIWVVGVLRAVLYAGAKGQALSTFEILQTLLLALVVATLTVALAFES
jgi:hypothetical protein